MKRALCVLSGGMDSTLCAYIAKSLQYDILAVHFDYNQRTMKKERECFEKICKELEAKKIILDAKFLCEIGGSSLTDLNLKIPKDKFNHSQNIPNTYVPFRNGIFLSICGAIAEKNECEAIFIGVVQEDSSGYPDCTQNFINYMQQAINSGTATKKEISIKTPLIHLTKAQIVKKSIELGVKLEYTWSCYERQDIACGRCDSCILRLNGFKQAGLKDKIPYEIDCFK